MTISEQLSKILSDRNRIRTVFHSLGISSESADLQELAQSAETIPNQGAVSVELRAGKQYRIPQGYHNGNGVVTDVSVGGGSGGPLQSKQATPTKTVQTVTPDDAYYGLSAVEILPIPQEYQDVSIVTAQAEDIRAGKIIVDASGVRTVGVMADNGDVSAEMDGLTVSRATIAEGYTTGGTITLTDAIELALAEI